jgi:hypothetical protein
VEYVKCVEIRIIKKKCTIGQAVASP